VHCERIDFPINASVAGCVESSHLLLRHLVYFLRRPLYGEGIADVVRQVVARPPHDVELRRDCHCLG
jgi:hypothetical protein